MRSVGMDGDPGNPQHMKRETVIGLKQAIDRRKYRVDANAVAREMVFKLRMRALLTPRPHRPN
jgi:anti-sigma28 factor (negative regulator of flagellin synthesis)